MRLKCALYGAILTAMAIAAPALANPQHPLPVIVIHGEKGQALHDYMTRLAEWGFHGSVLAAQKGTVYLHNAYGVGNPEANLPWTTLSPAAMGAETYCRLHFERGDMPFKVAWVEGQCVGLRDSDSPARLFRPTSDTDFASFNLGGPGSNLKFSTGGSLLIETSTGTITARRAKE